VSILSAWRRVFGSARIVPKGRFPGVAGLALAAIGLSACAQLDAADDLGAVAVSVGREPGVLTVSAPLWSRRTLIFLCPELPTESSEGLTDAGTIRLSGDCQSYGEFDAVAGLEARLSFASMDSARAALFDRTPEWILVLIAVGQNGPGAIFKTVVPGGPLDASPSLVSRAGAQG
jgi:hypothetical protein